MLSHLLSRGTSGGPDFGNSSCTTSTLQPIHWVTPLTFLIYSMCFYFTTFLYCHCYIYLLYLWLLFLWSFFCTGCLLGRATLLHRVLMSDQDQHSCFTNGDHSPNSDSSISPQSSLVGALESISTIPYPQEPNLSFDTLRDQSSLSPSSSPTNSAISVVSTIINQPHPSLLSHIMDQHSQEQAQSLDWFQQFLQAYTRTQLAQTEALVA